MSNTEPAPINEAPELLLFTYRFSTAIECGTSIVRGLLALQNSPPPLGAAIEEINQQVQQGQTLSGAMASRPEIFSPLYVAVIRAGEVGGVLDETLRRLANLMLKEWRLTQPCPAGESPFLLLQPGQCSPAQTWDDLSRYQQTVTLILLCETFGMLLSSGVPILRCIECVSPLLPQSQARMWLESSQALGQGESVLPSLENLNIFSPLTLEILRTGERMGTLDLMLLRAATLYEIELECRWP